MQYSKNKDTENGKTTILYNLTASEMNKAHREQSLKISVLSTFYHRLMEFKVKVH